MNKLANMDISQALRHFFFALIVGVVCGLASVVLCICVGWSYDAFNSFKWLVWILPIIGIAELLAYKYMKLAQNMTTHLVIESIRANKRVSYLLAPGILLTTCMSILCGGSVGKEAGALQMGASLGSLIAKPMKIASISPEDAESEKALEVKETEGTQAASDAQVKQGSQTDQQTKKAQGSHKAQESAKVASTGASTTASSSNAKKPHLTKKGHAVLNNYPAACGMAACFAALFFAPLGSCMFVLELTNFRKPVLRHVVTILIACFVAYFVASIIGIGDIIAKVDLPQITWLIVGQCVVIGVAAALVGTLFDMGIKYLHVITQRITKNYYVWVVVGGLIFAVLITFCGWDAFTGTGGDNLANVLKGEFGPWDFLVKALLTLICLGFWFKGGEIMPSFCIGGLLGASTSYLTGGDPVFGAAIGVLAFFAAFSRCPLAAFLMGCEIFGWAAAPFLAIAIMVSYMFGYPIGMYGEGLDKHAHKLWHRVRHTLANSNKIA